MVIEIENCYCCGQEKVNTKKTTGNRAICNNCHNPMLLSCKHNKGGEK